MTIRRLFVAAILAGSSLTPAFAQEAQPPLSPPTEEEPSPVEVPAEGETTDIIVTGTRQRGQVDGDIPPEVQLDERDIATYGAGSISELLDALAPLTQSSRGRGGGRPVVLVNGQRISGFSEIRNLPPEAIERVDILPEEVALRYGYRADQRVVNFVLKRDFSALTTEARAGLATEGGRETYSAEANLLRIDETGRWNIDGEYRRQNALFESERDILQRDPDALFDERPFRSLTGESDTYSLAGTLNRLILGNVGATVNARVEGSDSRAFIGLPDEGGVAALTRDTTSNTGHLGIALNGNLQPFRWSFTGNYDRGHSETIIETGAVPSRAETWTQVASAELVATGPLFELPAGEVSTTLRAGASHQGLRSDTSRDEFEQQRELSRGTVNAQASLDVPIASRRLGILDPIGDLSVNFNAEVERLSDFGTLRTLGAGLNWSPVEEVRFIASITDEDGAPSMTQLGDPTVIVPNVRVFDFVRGETVDVLRIEGGNPALLADNRRVWKLGVNVRPFDETDLSFRADYTNSRIRNPIASFPTATAQIEAAFPERFVRDADGNLVRIDSRPVNFARAEQSELRWGLNYSKSLGPEREGARGGRGARGGEGGGGPRAMAGLGRGGRGGGGAGGRLNFSIFHTWRFTDRILIREGVPELDLLNGAATGSRGGQPRHEIDVQAGITKDGFGARLNAQWQSGTTVLGGSDGMGGTTGNLRFDDFTSVNLRLFANLNQQESLLAAAPWLKDTRLTLSVDNLFNNRLQVRDEFGSTPISYQPDYLDPVGRVVTIGIRKQF